MKQNTNFTLKEIAGVPYLLPFGQMIADHKRGLKTNATGVYLWNLLEEEHSLEEVISKSAAYYEVSANDYPSFQEDITHFIKTLLYFGILMNSKENSSNTTDIFHTIQSSRNTGAASAIPVLKADSIVLSIGGLNLKLITPQNAFPPEFADFVIPELQTKNIQIHQTIFLHPSLPQQEIQGQILLHSSELNIIEQETQYLLHFPVANNPLEIHLSKDGSTAHCYCLPPYTDAFHYDFFHAIRLVYLYLAQKSGMVALHSASILYQDKLWLFSGHSGMGKSTHTNLWKEYLNTPVINGDLNLLAMENGQPVVHGIPWCGTSGIYDAKTYHLGGIILLNQATENLVEELTTDQKQLLIFQRLISPSWTKELWEQNLKITEHITKDILVCKLLCTKEKEAAKVMKQRIDAFLS